MKRIVLMVRRLLAHIPGWFYKMCKMAGDTEDKIYDAQERIHQAIEAAISTGGEQDV